MTFGEALEQLKLGKKLKRKNWNGKNQFVFQINGMDLKTLLNSGVEDYWQVGEWKDDTFLNLSAEKDVNISDLLAIKTTSNQIQLGWLASQTDMLSDDWEIVDDSETRFDQCDLVLVEDGSGFNRYINILRQANDISTFDADKCIIYKKSQRWPVYVRNISRMAMLDGFNKRINNTVVFISPTARQVDDISLKIKEWIQFINHINARYPKFKEE